MHELFSSIKIKAVYRFFPGVSENAAPFGESIREMGG
jgi:hypothetical protein